MMYAVKGNKQLKIDEAEKAAYLSQGFDIAEEREGKLETLEESPAKTIPMAQYKAVLAQVEELKKENKSLKDKLAEANKKLKETGKE